MPPKNNEKKAKPSAAKIVEDKTFGMKNKKGSQAQKQIQAIKSQAASAKTPEQKRKDAEKAQREKEKAASEQAKRETADLFKPVQVQKVPFGVDPKTVLCQYYKQGNCEKGRKCKFSHDLAVERKGEKRNLYQDSRDAEKEREEEERKKDDMVDWDEAKLREVVLSKHGNPKTTTDKVCKYFIEAVENGKYGWFWSCPNGGDKCMYKHSLPPGFILKTRDQRLAEKALLDKSPLKTLTLEDFLETERQKLSGTLTPVTPESFAKWKKERLDKKAAEEEAKRAKEATGRAMFESGGWEESSDEDEDEDEEDEDGEEGEGEEGDDGWDMEGMRRETERVREEEERRRVEGLGGQAAIRTEGVGGGEDGAVGMVVNGHS
ncbi:MAG: hypothetical protein HETSPECPRED_008488 [Heterodermia speciosa]|uniref:C3H1-type domain-containing protein n=1 Tax=Heterodermia speciosa TaxID=116794 RepID=A0A8H3G4E3_9LECA|nr:MAG: hypothetical protein HETSPECPRED_008488 [Heterodermia speciosa]